MHFNVQIFVKWCWIILAVLIRSGYGNLILVRCVKDFCSGLLSPLVSLDKSVTFLKHVAYDKIGLEMSQDSIANYRKVSKVTTPRKYPTSESSDNMSQVVANPESSDPPENNDPAKVETSKLISLMAKNNGYDRYPEQIKFHTNLRFINDGYLISSYP